MSMRSDTKIAELEEKVEGLEKTLAALRQQREEMETRMKSMEDKYIMLNARLARGKTD
jgi:phage shock protein A